MNAALIEELKSILDGDVATDEETLIKYNHDASIFAVKPQIVVFPKNDADIKKLVKFVAKYKHAFPDLSLTARAASTCMSGGGLTDSILVAFQKYFNHKPKVDVKARTASVEPGVFYRDFEKETVKHKLLYPAFPSSRELCAIGGMINNNAGGEKSLEFGKAEDYVHSSKMVLADGNEYTFSKLNETELHKKMKQQDFEGEIYREIFKLIDDNYEILQSAKPDVSKNSAGYYLWNVYDREKKTFDLNKLFVGAQGTLGLMTEVELKLVPVTKHSEMLVILLNDFSHLSDIVNAVLPLKPNSFETYDDKTLKLALRFFPEFAKKLGTRSLLTTALKFLPELELFEKNKLPKLVLQVEFTGDDKKELQDKIYELQKRLAPLHPDTRVVLEEDEKKYWLIRRDSFGLLRSHIKDMYSSPFIDDIIVKPEFLPEFLPRFNKILKRYPSFIATFAGHIGNGNFHVIPLVKLTDPNQQRLIPKLSEEVFALVMEYKGSTSGEHNDGLIRTPYLPMQFDHIILELFEKTKHIFDPHGIFNPRKKVKGDLAYAMRHIRTSW